MLDLKQKIWPDQSEHGRLRLASERAVSVFFTLAGVSGLAITAINIPYLEDYPLSVTLGGLISLMCLAGPFITVRDAAFRAEYAHSLAPGRIPPPCALADRPGDGEPKQSAVYPRGIDGDAGIGVARWTGHPSWPMPPMSALS